MTWYSNRFNFEMKHLDWRKFWYPDQVVCLLPWKASIKYCNKFTKIWKRKNAGKKKSPFPECFLALCPVDTVVAKSNGTLAHFSNNAPFLPEGLLKLKNILLSTYVFLWFEVEQNKKSWKKLLNLSFFQTEIRKWSGQYYWHLLEVARNN